MDKSEIIDILEKVVRGEIMLSINLAQEIITHLQACPEKIEPVLLETPQQYIRYYKKTGDGKPAFIGEGELIKIESLHALIEIENRELKVVPFHSTGYKIQFIQCPNSQEPFLGQKQESATALWEE